MAKAVTSNMEAGWILFPGVQTLQRLNNVRWNLSCWLHHRVIDEKRVANSHVNSDGASRQLPIKTQGSLGLGKGLFVCWRKQWVESIQQCTPLFRPLHWKLHRMHFPFNPILITAKSATFNYQGHRLNRQCLLPRVFSALVHEHYWLYYFCYLFIVHWDQLFITISYFLMQQTQFTCSWEYKVTLTQLP